MIYFAQDELTRRVKIGHAETPDKRLKGLATGNPGGHLVLLGTLEGGPESERMLHNVFGGWRRGGEWFVGSDRLLREVGRLLTRCGTPATLDSELKRRHGCRAGLDGVTVCPLRQPDNLLRVVLHRWEDASTAALEVLLVYRESFGEYMAWVADGQKEEDETIYPEMRKASELVLCGWWPTPCPCWRDDRGRAVKQAK